MITDGEDAQLTLLSHDAVSAGINSPSAPARCPNRRPATSFMVETEERQQRIADAVRPPEQSRCARPVAANGPAVLAFRAQNQHLAQHKMSMYRLPPKMAPSSAYCSAVGASAEPGRAGAGQWAWPATSAEIGRPSRALGSPPPTIEDALAAGPLSILPRWLNAGFSS